MTLTIELPEKEMEALAVKAEALGVSAEDYVRQVLERESRRPIGTLLESVYPPDTGLASRGL